MFIPSSVQQNRKVADFLYRTQKNIKIIRIVLKQQQQQKKNRYPDITVKKSLRKQHNIEFS